MLISQWLGVGPNRTYVSYIYTNSNILITMLLHAESPPGVGRNRTCVSYLYKFESSYHNAVPCQIHLHLQSWCLRRFSPCNAFQLYTTRAHIKIIKQGFNQCEFTSTHNPNQSQHRPQDVWDPVVLCKTCSVLLYVLEKQRVDSSSVGPQLAQGR